MPGELKSAEELEPGHGGILRDGLKRLAACRDTNGALHVRSAVCTCHGSQFAPDGSVLNGPAMAPLAETEEPPVKRRA